ncbi:MAG TPA: BACON domain-containing carbohydrate-binding protein [Paludibaculum sp.]|jgi:hypothetical protein
MFKLLQGSIALLAFALLPQPLAAGSAPRTDIVTLTAIPDAGASAVHMRLAAPDRIGRKVAILDGFRIAGYATIAPDGSGEFTLSNLMPGQHWLRANIAGASGERSAAVPVAIPAARNRRDFADRLEEPARGLHIDLNQDNINDQVLIRPNSIAIALGDGHGGFSHADTMAGDWNSLDFTGASVSSDWNEDGFPDLAFGAAGGVLVCFGDGQAGCQSTQWFDGVHLRTSDAAGDLNGDGHADLLVLRESERGPTLAALLGDGRGAMTPAPDQLMPEPFVQLAGNLSAEDRDGDGVIDLIQAGESSKQLWRRAAGGAFYLDATKPIPQRPLEAGTFEPERSANLWGTTYYGQLFTIAGGGTNSPGDGGSALSARLGWIGSVARDRAGNIYFLDLEYNKVRLITLATGIITTVAGGGSAIPGDGGLATAASLGTVSDLALDSAGNLFISDEYAHRIRKVEKATGLISTVAGTGIGGFSGDGQAATSAQLANPKGIAIDAAGNLFIADRNNNRVRKVNALTGIIQTVAGTGVAGVNGDGAAAISAQLSYPSELRIDSNGDLLFSDGGPRVRKVSTSSGLISTVAGGGPLGLTDGVQATSAFVSSINGLSTDSNGSFTFNSSYWVKVSPANVLFVLTQCCAVPNRASVADGFGNLIVAGYDYNVGANKVAVLDLTSPKFTLSTYHVDAPAKAGSGTVTVTSNPAGGPWTASSDVPWLQITPSSGTGTATLTFSYLTTNTVNARTGKITIAGQTLTVYQAGGTPTYSLSGTSAALGSQASSGTVNLTVFPPDASWRVMGSPAWLTVLPSSGVGSASLTFSAPANLTADTIRGVFSIKDYYGYGTTSSVAFTVTQAPGATVGLSPFSASVSAAAGTLTVQVTTTPSGAAWSPSVDAGWLKVAPATGSGAAALTVSYARNNTTNSRSGAVSIGNQKMTITQAAAPAPYSLWPTSWWGQIITIGGGGNTWPGDGGPATSASMNEPNGIVVDPAGNVYFCDSSTMSVRTIEGETGQISSIPLGFTSYFGPPHGLAMSSNRDLYFSNSVDVIYRLPGIGGLAELFAGGGNTLGDGGQAAAGQLSGPRGIDIDKLDRLFIAEATGHRIRRIDLATGIITTVAGIGTAGFGGDGALATSAQLNTPSGVAIDAAGNILIADTANRRIRRVNAITGIITTVAGGGSASPGDGGAATSAVLVDPYEVRVSPTGDYFVTEYNGSRIRRIELATGLISTAVGTGAYANGTGGDSAISTPIGRPYRIAFDAIGNLYMTDPGYSRIRYIDYVSPRSTLTPEKLYASGAAGTGLVLLAAQPSTGSWTLTNNTPSWLTVTPTSGTGNASLNLIYPANPSIGPRTATFTVRNKLFTLTQAGGFIPPPILSLDRTRLNFAARDNIAVSPAQQVVVSFGGGTAAWTASTNQPWLLVSPSSGTGATRLTVIINTGFLPPSGTAVGTLTISAPTATPTSKTVTVYLTRVTAPSPPFGAFDTPTNNATNIAGSIAVTGWAMDDIGVFAVRIYRDKIGNEGVQPNGYVYIGDATFVPNARGDIEGLNPTLPASYRGGWGYLMLTNAIPGGTLPQGNGTIRLWAIATDVEGNTTNLGSKVITLENANSKLPFGAIDSPGQGGIAVGVVNNSGWIMTPQPNTMAAAAPHITAYIDGVPVGAVTYGQPRGDVAGLFPSYRNSAGPGATFSLDTTLYSNAMHSIFWVATDDAGNTDGIGSRFFVIENGVSAGIANPAPPVQSSVRAARPRPQRAAVPQVRTAQELERLVIDLPEGTWTGAHIINGEPQPLPVGSTLDNTNGAFYWHLGPGFLGRHELLFTSTDGAIYGVTVNIEPKTFGASE